MDKRQSGSSLFITTLTYISKMIESGALKHNVVAIISARLTVKRITSSKIPYLRQVLCPSCLCGIPIHGQLVKNVHILNNRKLSHGLVLDCLLKAFVLRLASASQSESALFCDAFVS